MFKSFEASETVQRVVPEEHGIRTLRPLIYGATFVLVWLVLGYVAGWELPQ